MPGSNGPNTDYQQIRYRAIIGPANSKNRLTKTHKHYGKPGNYSNTTTKIIHVVGNPFNSIDTSFPCRTCFTVLLDKSKEKFEGR